MQRAGGLRADVTASAAGRTPRKSPSSRSTTPGSRPCAARSTRTCARSRPRSTCTIARHGERFSIAGPRDKAAQAATALERFYDQAARELSVEDIQLGLVEIAHRAEGARRSNAPALLLPRRTELTARTPRQAQYLQAMRSFDITFCVGPAGTGKTFLAVAAAVDALERDAVKRIVLTRPAVEAGEKLGFLPGDLAQKVDPYLRPLYDALYDLMGYDKVMRAFERGAIEIAPLAFMRGRTLNHSFVILDEAQNTTPEQMKMFLTRIGFGSKAVVTGDVTQIDLAKGQASGLVDAREVLDGVRGIALTEFQSEDVVRHPLVQAIVDAYERRPKQARWAGPPELAIQRASRAAHIPSDARAPPVGAGGPHARGERHAPLRRRGRGPPAQPRVSAARTTRPTCSRSSTSDDARLAGDVVICAPVVAREAREQGKAVARAPRAPARPRTAAPAGHGSRGARAEAAAHGGARARNPRAAWAFADPYAWCLSGNRDL